VPRLDDVTCDDGSLPIITYELRIVSFRWQERRRPRFLRIVETTITRPQQPGVELISTPPVRRFFSGPTAYSALSYAQAFQVRKRSAAGALDFERNDRYTVEVRVRWHCDGATSDVEAEYVFAGVGVDLPTVTNSSWNIVPS